MSNGLRINLKLTCFDVGAKVVFSAADQWSQVISISYLAEVVMKHPNAVSLAERLLDSRLKRNGFQAMPSQAAKLNEEQRAWALEILSTHLDACMRQGIPTDFSEAVEDALEFAARHETAYERIPEGARWHSALVLLEEQDAD